MKLATGLCLYVLCICVCIFAGISIVLEKYTATRESEQAHRLTELLQSQMVRSVDEDLDRAARNAYRTAREISEMTSPVDETAAARLLGIMIESDPVIKGGCMAYLPERISGNAGEWMVYAHRTASGIESSQLGDTDYAYTSQPWFTDPIASGNPTWSKPYVDKGGGDCLMTTYSIPLKDDSGTIYALGSKLRHSAIDMRIALSADKVTVIIIDEGTPFNPTEQDPGTGLGLMLVRKTCDSQKYEYLFHQNILTIEWHR